MSNQEEESKILKKEKYVDVFQEEIENVVKDELKQLKNFCEINSGKSKVQKGHKGVFITSEPEIKKDKFGKIYEIKVNGSCSNPDVRSSRNVRIKFDDNQLIMEKFNNSRVFLKNQYKDLLIDHIHAGKPAIPFLIFSDNINDLISAESALNNTNKRRKYIYSFKLRANTYLNKSNKMSYNELKKNVTQQGQLKSVLFDMDIDLNVKNPKIDFSSQINNWKFDQLISIDDINNEVHDDIVLGVSKSRFKKKK